MFRFFLQSGVLVDRLFAPSVILLFLLVVCQYVVTPGDVLKFLLGIGVVLVLVRMHFGR